MALFKPFRGNRAALDTIEKHDGYAYFCMDDGTFHIDYVDSDGNLHRKQINADEANKLAGYNIATVLNSSNTEIPTSKAVLDAIPEQVQSNWEETDETSPAYIQNKPAEMTEDDMLALLVELGAVDPISTIDNIIYTNSSDQIYIL